MLHKCVPIVFMLILLSAHSFAQDNSNQVEFTAIHSLSVFTPDNYKINGEVWGGEFAYHLNMSENNADYIKMLHIKSIDIAAFYRSMRNLLINGNPHSKDSLGQAYTALARLEIGLLKGGPFKLLFMPGLGFTYSTQTFFTDKNPVVGSHFNIAAQAGLKVFATITHSTGIMGGVDLLHYSNVGVRVPNLGVNSFNVSLSLVQSINKTTPAKPVQLFTYPYKGSFEFGGDFGMRGVPYTKDELYRMGLYAGYNYLLNSIFSVKAGFDAGYYFTPFDPKAFSRTFAKYGSSYDNWRGGMSAGVDIALGRLSVMAAYGYYLHYHSYFNNKTYWTPGLKYYICPWMAIQAKAYIHNTNADYLGWGLLFRIRS